MCAARLSRSLRLSVLIGQLVRGGWGGGGEEESTSVYAHLCYANQSAAIVVVLVVVFVLSTLPVWLSKRQMPLKMDIDTLRYVVMLGVIAIRLRFDYQQQQQQQR